MHWLKLTLKSMLSRKGAVGLLTVSIALSAVLLIGIQKIKLSAKDSFSQSISGTDLIVGARSGDAQLLMYTVFRQGQAVANVSWRTIQDLAELSSVKWLVPISLGDSHKGYPVLGTTDDYFNYYQYGKKKALELKTGDVFQTPFDVVLGADVAKTLHYHIGDTLRLSHGLSKQPLMLHKNQVFRVVGILKSTGTPVDKTLHISLAGMQALHIKWPEGIYSSSLDDIDLTPRSVTSALIGLASKQSIFHVQRQINNWPDEPLMAIMPSLSLRRLWQSIRPVDTAFLIISVMVLLIAFIGLLLSLFMSLQQRKRELAILRMMGASPVELAGMLVLESLIITISGVVLSFVIMMVVGIFLTPVLESQFGLVLSLTRVVAAEWYLALGIILFGVIISFIPAVLVYKREWSEGIAI